MCSKTSKTTGLLCKARHYIRLGILRSLYHSLVYPYVYYGNICWGSYTYSTRLIRFNQKNPGKVYKINHVCWIQRAYCTSVYKGINVTIRWFKSKLITLFMFRFFNTMLPDSFNDYFMLNKELHHYNTRSSTCVYKNYARTNYG